MKPFVSLIAGCVLAVAIPSLASPPDADVPLRPKTCQEQLDYCLNYLVPAGYKTYQQCWYEFRECTDTHGATPSYSALPAFDKLHT